MGFDGYGFNDIGLQSTDIIFPEEGLISGDTWIFCRNVGRYATGFTATITFASNVNKLTVTAVKSGADFYWSVPGTSSSTLPPGSYSYVVQVTDQDGNRYTVEQGGIKITPDITTSSPVDTQTVDEQLLDACNATLQSLVSQQTSAIMFQGQTYTLLNIKELYAIRNDLLIRVSDAEQRSQGNKRANRIITRFVNR